MEAQFRQSIERIKSMHSTQLPRVRFSSEIRGAMLDTQDVLDHFEAMVILLEAHPFFHGYTFGSGALDLRRFLAYEVILRQIGHSRSLVANANVFNHIGTAAAVRCMLELYAFVVYIEETESIENERSLEKLLYGSVLSSGEWYGIKKERAKLYDDEPFPDEIREFIRVHLKTLHASKYLKHVKTSDEGFDYMYAVYSNYVHPSFGPPRVRFLEAIGYRQPDPLLDPDSPYLSTAQQSPSPPAAIRRDIDAGDFCLEMFWPKVIELDPFFDETCQDDIVEALASQGLEGMEAGSSASLDARELR